MFNSIICFSQNETKIKQIRELYKDYNENLSNMDTYEIKLNTAGSYPSLVIHTDSGDKVMIKTGDASEFGSSSAEYYYLKDTIQFIFSKSERLLTHWGADTVRYEMLELRFYFENGQVIKTLKKQFKGIEGHDDKIGFSQMPNKTINYKKDFDANWNYYDEKIADLIKLYANLERIF